jgi:hypothetical protein
MNGLLTGQWQRPGPPERVSPIPRSLMIVVENALSLAWRVLLRDVDAGRFSLCSAKEDEITEQLQVILGELHAADPEQIAGFSQFSLARDGKLRGCDGEHMDRQPDLTFSPLRGRIPTTNMAFAAIFVECKPVGAKHPVGSTYCAKGLIRFVRGDYAWAVDRALMVGYVRNRCWLPDGLASSVAAEEYRCLSGVKEALQTALGDKVFQSGHGRSCSLADGLPEPITLDHLWLYPDSPCEESRCQGCS